MYIGHEKIFFIILNNIMPKCKFYTDKLHSYYSTKSSGTICFEAQLEKIDNVLKILHTHTDGANNQCPWQILHNMVRNNEYLFGFKFPDIIPCTLNYGQLNQKCSSQLKGESSSSYFTQMVPFVDEANACLVPKIKETYSLSKYGQKKVEFWKKAKIPNSPVEDDKMDIVTNENAEGNINPKDKNKAKMGFKEDIKFMIGRNLAQIISASITKESKFTEVEIDTDFSCLPDESFPKKSEQESGTSRKVPSPEKPEKIISPTHSPSKLSKNRPIATSRPVSRLTVDNLDRHTLNFLTTRLLSILSYRKGWIKQIEKYFQKCEEDARKVQETMKDLITVVDNLNPVREPYVTVDLLQLLGDLSKKASEIANVAKSWSNEIFDVISILRKCEQENYRIDDEYTRHLSERNVLINDGYLMIIESHLKDFCTKANEMMIIKNDIKAILLKTLREFEWFVNHFVKYLIIMGILK